ncbi:alpha/beta hydrolase [Pseudonocardia sp.]|uniref:alpha/beta fold hydrolase n=1 Tax=Pseudonocardia sp. TaxID=60912 RepID=UPI0031FCAF8B
MVVRTRGTVRVDVLEKGSGPTVVLLPGSPAGLSRWEGLVEELADDHHVLTVALHGHGATPPWSAPRRQSLTDQVRLVHAVTAGRDEPVSLIGHGIGGAVAMRAAVELGERAEALVLVEPVPFSLLARAGRHDVFDDVCRLRDRVVEAAEAQRCAEAAPSVTDQWFGEGTWASLSERCRTRLVDAIGPGRHEWDAITDPGLTLAEVTSGSAATLLLVGPTPQPSIRDLADVLAQARPDWTVREQPGAGSPAGPGSVAALDSVVLGFLRAAR